MSYCSRCQVEEIMQKRGVDNVVEVVRPPVRDGWIPYDIYVYPATFDGDEILVDGRSFAYSRTVFSRKHSLDDDCWLGEKSGFPRVVEVEDD